MAVDQTSPQPHMSTLNVSITEGVALLEFNRPKELNSFISQQYADIASTLEELTVEEKCVVAVLTGTGPYFTSGHFLGNFMQQSPEDGDLEKILKERVDREANRLIRAIIDFPKPLIMAVNGHAVGIGCTMTQLGDIAYCSDAASFEVPFMKLGFCAEGCSSVLFPEILGQSKANEMLLLGKKLSASEAERTGFVAAIFPHDNFRTEVMKRAKQMASFPPGALRTTKQLVKMRRQQLLHEVNTQELAALVKRFISDECAEAVMKHMMEQKRKKTATEKSKSKL